MGKVNKIDFEKDGRLSRENIPKLYFACTERRNKLWCGRCSKSVKITCSRVAFLNNVIDQENILDMDVKVFEGYLGRYLEAWKV